MVEDSQFFPRHRLRSTHDGVLGGIRYPPRVVSPTDTTIPYGFAEEMYDEVHHFVIPQSTRGDVGGPMYHVRSGTTYHNLISIDFDPTYVGTIGCGTPTWTQEPSITPKSEAQVNALGTTMVARALPTNPAASLTTFLGELREDGLPHLPGSEALKTTRAARSAGSEYLNVEFGWLPFVSDLRKFAYAVKHSTEITRQYVRDSDRKIRRRYGGPGESVSSFKAGPCTAAPVVVGIPMDTTTSVATITTRTWFSGAFRYHIPLGNSTGERLLRHEALANHLLGTRITPETVWNVAPWTWAIDWFTNTGDVIHNIVGLGTDGLVMQYGYAMDTVEKNVFTSGRVSSVANAHIAGAFLSKTKTELYARRVAANPYGFGITDASLSKRQLSILAALGLTRGRRQHP